MTPVLSNESAGVEWVPTLARAANLAAELAPHADATERARQVRDEAMLALYREHLLRHLQPELYGGDCAPWGIQFDLGRLFA